MEPRQPRDLEGLLKFCMEATQSEDAPNDPNQTLENMNPERRQWLEQALSSMSVDVIKELTEAMKILQSPAVQDPNADQEEISKVEYAFDCIGDWVGQIDMANNFHKIGGFNVLKKCLKSPHDTIRCETANAIAELSQNNPYCQEKLVEDDFLPILMEILSSDKACQVKALYAISCITRECSLAQDKFFNDLNGLSLIINTTLVSDANERLRTKGCFYLSAICDENDQAKKTLIDMGLPRQILTLMQIEDHSQDHEHMARALWTVLKNNEQVKNELVNSSELNLREFLTTRMEVLKDHPEFQEESDYLNQVAKECFGNGLNNMNDVDR